MTADISKKAMDRIRKEAIRPETQWQFLLRRSLLWLGIAATASIGAWSLSMLLFPLLSLGLDLPRSGWPHFFGPFLFRPAPLIWGAFVLVFVVIAVIEFRRIGRGYRHRVAAIALGILVLVVLLSGIFHALRVNEMSERGIRRHFPPYKASSIAPEDFWIRADEGFLMGTIRTEGLGAFQLEDPDGETWRIIITASTDIRPPVDLEVGEDVKIVGERIGEDRFEADEILPGAPPVFRGQGPGNGPRDGSASPRPDINPDRIHMR
jgi:hypothetical protein